MKERCILLAQFTSIYMCFMCFMCFMLLSTAPIIFVHSTGRLVFVLDTVFSVRKEREFCELDNVDDRDS
jgi:hypothetical protein